MQSAHHEYLLVSTQTHGILPKLAVGNVHAHGWRLALDVEINGVLRADADGVGNFEAVWHCLGGGFLTMYATGR